MNKDKILKPYELLDDCSYVRCSLTHIYYGVVYKHMSCNVWYSSENWNNAQMGVAEPYTSKEGAIAALDKVLIDTGFTILTQEQYDKLIILI